MSWQKTLGELFKVLKTVVDTLDDGAISAALSDIKNMPSLQEVFEFLTDESKVDDLLAASRALTNQHQELMKVTSVRWLTDDEYVKLGTLSAAAYALSAEALARTMTKEAIILHNVKVVYPVLVKLAKSGLLALV